MTLDHLTKEDISWILNDYAKIRNHSYINGYINEHVKFQSIMKNKKVERPDCGCNFHSFKNISNSIFEQYEAELKNMYQEDSQNTPKDE